MTGKVSDTRTIRRWILRRFSLSADSKLGEGDEAEVYALGADRVVKLFKPTVDPLGLDRRLAFYASLDASTVPFAVPRIIELNEEGGCRYTIEVRIPGRSLIDTLPHLDEARRSYAIMAYADAATEIGRIGCPRPGFGDMVSVPPLVAPSWSEFIVARAKADLNQNRGRINLAIDQPERAIDRLEQLSSGRLDVEPGLVLGDYHPANVMVDDRGHVTGVVDFSGLTLFGDPRLDMAASVLNLNGLDGVTALDREAVLGRLRKAGLHEDDLELYRLYSAFRFLDTPRDGLFHWCLATIRAAC